MNESTESKLRIAYASLIRKQGEKMTVTELCKKADVSRATFYIYYKDIDEYKESLRKHIILKLFEQAALFTCCSDHEFKSVIKKENHIIDEYEIRILDNMLSGANYLSFATVTNSYYVHKNNYPFSDYAWEHNREEIDLFTRGYLFILIVDLINYDESLFRSDMRNCRSYYKSLCERFEKRD